jgi:hypothetical protein
MKPALNLKYKCDFILHITYPTHPLSPSLSVVPWVAHVVHGDPSNLAVLPPAHLLAAVQTRQPDRLAFAHLEVLFPPFTPP